MSSKKYKGKGERRLSPFLDVPKSWEKHWQGMPEFVQNDETSYKKVIVHFSIKEDMEAFAKLIKQKITYETKFIWFPKVEQEKLLNYQYIDSENES